MTKSVVDRKNRERFLLERFLSIAKIDAVVSEEGESPDFGVLFEGRLVGVEITEIYAATPLNQLSLQAHESLSSRVVALAKRLYEKAGGSPVHVSISFFPAFDIRAFRRERVASALASLVQELDPIRGRSVSWRNDYSNDDLAPIAFVNALGIHELQFAHWGVSAAGWSVPLTRELLQQSVSKKGLNIAQYRARYAEVWLIVAALGSQPSQFFDMNGLSGAAEIYSVFDRTYYCSSFTSELVRLGASRCLNGD